jgi:hypothetical protein
LWLLTKEAFTTRDDLASLTNADEASIARQEVPSTIEGMAELAISSPRGPTILGGLPLDDEETSTMIVGPRRLARTNAPMVVGENRYRLPKDRALTTRPLPNGSR